MLLESELSTTDFQTNCCGFKMVVNKLKSTPQRTEREWQYLSLQSEMIEYSGST